MTYYCAWLGFQDCCDAASIAVRPDGTEVASWVSSNKYFAFQDLQRAIKDTGDDDPEMIWVEPKDLPKRKGTTSCS